MVVPEPPPLLVMCLSYMSQSFVTCIVGVSLGFKKANREIVTKIVKSTFKSSRSA
jgi:hypothetical protein